MGWTELLVCPRCRADLDDLVDDLGEALACAACQLRYPLVDGVPWVTEDLAEPWRG